VENAWFIDIGLRNTNRPYTFVKFALVRFQPNSREDARLSSPVLADFAQIFPDRTVTVRHLSRKQLIVDVYGAVEDGTVGVRTRREVAVMRPKESRDSSDAGPVWEKDASVNPVPSGHGSTGNTESKESAPLESWTIEFPERTVGRRLVVVKEFETLRTDVTETNQTNKDYACIERLIYSDAIELSDTRLLGFEL
jgi:hypothetical protein